MSFRRNPFTAPGYYREVYARAPEPLKRWMRDNEAQLLEGMAQELGHKPPSLLRTIDLFAGAGGFTLGAMQAGCTMGFGVELDPVAVRTARKAGQHVAQMDVGETGNYEDVLWGVDLLIGGPPCQPFSEMGRGSGQYDPRDGFPLVLRVIDELQPRRTVMENVRGFMSQRYKAYRERVLADLAQRFNYVGVWQLDAADFGVPQHRKRVFVWGAEVPLEPPVPTHGPNAGRPYRSVAEALPHLRGEAPAVHIRSKTAKSRSILEPAPTVATKGTMYTAVKPGLVYGKDPAEGRRITPQEQQLLQAFPGTYEFTGGISEQYRQVGNAVPPPLGRAVIEAMTAGIVSKRLPPDAVLAMLKAQNPEALYFDPHETWNPALVGITNAADHSPGDLVAVYDADALLDIALDQVYAQEPDIDPEEAFNWASDWVYNDMMVSTGWKHHQPMVIKLEDPVEWNA